MPRVRRAQQRTRRDRRRCSAPSRPPSARTSWSPRTAAALTKLYDAFKPLVVDEFPTNPFATFTNRFGFLDATPATTAQVRFMQYYWDLFDDLLAAYDELRWKGVDLMCACCPPEGLFPRHLMAGVLDPATYDAADYRHRFVPSPAVGDCEDRTREVRLLFRRLVAIAGELHRDARPDKGDPGDPEPVGRRRRCRPRRSPTTTTRTAPRRCSSCGTRSRPPASGPTRTSATGPTSTRRPPPAFVTDPLRFDLEPNNFLRIEGHLGKNVQSVLETLLSLKKSHRLPIEVIALRTGAFDENIEVDLSKEECRFQDLETLYEALKSELICFLVKQVQYFYALPRRGRPGRGGRRSRRSGC